MTETVPPYLIYRGSNKEKKLKKLEISISDVELQDEEMGEKIDLTKIPSFKEELINDKK